MRSQIFATAALALAALFAVPGGAVLAHHSNAEYGNTLTTMDATVVEYRWRNPHVTVVWNSTDKTGKTVLWHGELASITTLMASGLTKNSLKPGDNIKISVYASKLGTPSSVIQFIERPDGAVVLGWSNQAGGNPENRAKREREANQPVAAPPKQ